MNNLFLHNFKFRFTIRTSHTHQRVQVQTQNKIKHIIGHFQVNTMEQCLKRQLAFIKASPRSITPQTQTVTNPKNIKANGSRLNTSPRKQTNTTLKKEAKIDRLIETLYKKHEQMKRHIERLRKQKEQQEEKQFSQFKFSPNISHSPRYKISGPFFQRQKARKDQHSQLCMRISAEKQQQSKQECIFKPTIVSRKVSDLYLAKRNRRFMLTQEDQYSQNNMKQLSNEPKNYSGKFIQLDHSLTPKKKRKIPYEAMKTMIKTQLNRTQLL